MTRIRNATKRPLVRFRSGRVTGIRCDIINGQVESRFDPLGCDSSTGGEMGTVHGVLPQVYPEDGLEVVLIGQVPGTAMPLEPAEAKVAFKIERPAYLPWRAWGILDEFDTLYEIREKV